MTVYTWSFVTCKILPQLGHILPWGLSMCSWNPLKAWCNESVIKIVKHDTPWLHHNHNHPTLSYKTMYFHWWSLIACCYRPPTSPPKTPTPPKPGDFFGMAGSSKVELTLDIGFHHWWNLIWPCIWVVHVNLGFTFGVWLIIVDFHKANALSNYSKFFFKIKSKELVMGIFMVYIGI